MITYAFIFARGGSTGLPGKNIKELGGLSLLGHSIRTAQQISTIKKIYVSTDSDEIAKAASSFSVEVIKRPDFLATHTAAEWGAWQHAIEYLESRGERFDVFLSLPTTSPLRAVIDVQKCLDALSADTDAVITVTPSARSPYFNMVTRLEDGTSTIALGDAGVKRRQDAPQLYDVTTVAYVMRPEFIKTNTGFFAGRVKSVVVPKERAFDIDDSVDFICAEAVFKRGSHEFA